MEPEVTYPLNSKGHTYGQCSRRVKTRSRT